MLFYHICPYNSSIILIVWVIFMENLDYYEIGQRIRSARKAAGFSQEQLAELVDISVTHMSHIETGNTKLSLPVLAALSCTLRVSIDTLLYGEPPEVQTDALRELAGLLRDCTDQELAILRNVIRAVKAAL